MADEEEAMRDFDDKINYLQDRLKVLADSLQQLGAIDKEEILSKLTSLSQTQKDGYELNVYLIFFVAVLIISVLFVFFGYKLYKSLVEKERKRDEKKKQKQQKKKK